MTTIIMVEAEAGVKIAYDSLCSAGTHTFEIENRKVFPKGNMVFAVAGSLSDLVTVEAATFSEPPTDPTVTDRWVLCTLIPEIKKALTDAGRMGDDEGKADIASLLLIVINGRVYDIDHDFAWTRRTDGIYTIGSGNEYARGALSAGAEPIEALRISAMHDSATGGTLREMTV